ncbi:MAG: hypothetical protein M1828_004468 [Chrysothrix sp. TS-e1954]|nr:MAG: hypothetical protein M1828_004468 [Chrysothrix sp. TS-e1954]
MAPNIAKRTGNAVERILPRSLQRRHCSREWLGDKDCKHLLPFNVQSGICAPCMDKFEYEIDAVANVCLFFSTISGHQVSWVDLEKVYPDITHIADLKQKKRPGKPYYAADASETALTAPTFQSVDALLVFKMMKTRILFGTPLGHTGKQLAEDDTDELRSMEATLLDARGFFRRGLYLKGQPPQLRREVNKEHERGGTSNSDLTTKMCQLPYIPCRYADCDYTTTLVKQLKKCPAWEAKKMPRNQACPNLTYVVADGEKAWECGKHDGRRIMEKEAVELEKSTAIDKKRHEVLDRRQMRQANKAAQRAHGNAIGESMQHVRNDEALGVVASGIIYGSPLQLADPRAHEQPALKRAPELSAMAKPSARSGPSKRAPGTS